MPQDETLVGTEDLLHGDVAAAGPDVVGTHGEQAEGRYEYRYHGEDDDYLLQLDILGECSLYLVLDVGGVESTVRPDAAVDFGYAAVCRGMVAGNLDNDVPGSAVLRIDIVPVDLGRRLVVEQRPDLKIIVDSCYRFRPVAVFLISEGTFRSSLRQAGFLEGVFVPVPGRLVRQVIVRLQPQTQNVEILRIAAYQLEAEQAALIILSIVVRSIQRRTLTETHGLHEGQGLHGIPELPYLRP